MLTYRVVINGDTTATICDDTLDGQSAELFVGEVVRAKTKDENGFTVEIEGVLTEVLDSY